MFWVSSLDELHKKKRFRIYGDTLGAMHDVITLLAALEKNYNSILAYEKIVLPIGATLASKNKIGKEDLELASYELRAKIAFNHVSDFVTENEYLTIVKINFNSPGFWEVLGSYNPLRQIREYINERHNRQRDKNYAWNLEKRQKEVDIEKLILENDMKRLSIIKEMTIQLRALNLSDKEIFDITKDYYDSISLLNNHIDDGRITKIEEVQDEF